MRAGYVLARAGGAAVGRSVRPSGAQQPRRLLPGRAGLRQVRQSGRQLLAAPAHRLRPEPPGPVRRAHQRPRHDARRSRSRRPPRAARRTPPAAPSAPPGGAAATGRRYCVIVIRSQPASCRSRSACETSSRVSPMPEDEVRLRHHAGGPALGEHVQGALVPERRPDPLEDPRAPSRGCARRPAGAASNTCPQQLGLPGEVGHEDLDAGARVQLVDRADRLGVQPGALVVEVVAGHTRDGGVAQPHRLHAARHPPRLVPVQRRRACRCGSGRSRSAGCTRRPR